MIACSIPRYRLWDNWRGVIRPFGTYLDRRGAEQDQKVLLTRWGKYVTWTKIEEIGV